jgi:hypothetical protein
MILLTAEFYNSNEKIIDVNLQNVKSAKDAGNTQSNNAKISWGIVSNEASVSFNDNNGTILPIIKSVKDISTILCKIFINNTLGGKREQISEKYVSNIAYDKENKNISVSLKDNLEEWQKIQISGFSYNTTNSTPMSGRDFYLYLSSITPKSCNMCDFALLDYKTQEILENTQISYPMLNPSSLWQAWEKFAKLFGAYIYKTMHKNFYDNLVYTTLFSLDYSVYGV